MDHSGNPIIYKIMSAHHSCGHHHPAPQSFHKAFAFGILLNSLFIVTELFAGWRADSLALIADAVHNLGDVMGLIVAWFGYYLSQKRPSDRFTAGFGRMSIFTTILNGVFLVVSAIWIIIESVARINTPGEPVLGIVIVVALIGFFINIGTAFLLLRGQDDINIKGAMLHMMGDAGISLAVVFSAIVLHYTGWVWIDPALSLLVAAAILWSCWPLIYEGALLAMDAVPSSMQASEIEKFIVQHPGVRDIHDLRIWALSTTRTALSAHLEIDGTVNQTELLTVLHNNLTQKFRLDSVTLQIETDTMSCRTDNTDHDAHHDHHHEGHDHHGHDH